MQSKLRPSAVTIALDIPPSAPTCNPATRSQSAELGVRAEMQLASAAFTSAEARALGMQRTSSDQSAISSSTQHDSDAVSANMSPVSECCDLPVTEQHLEAWHLQAPGDERYSVDAVHYSRHQVKFSELYCRFTVNPGQHFAVPVTLPGLPPLHVLRAGCSA